jgi:hypothetical protein
MKTVFNNDMTIHVWAQQSQDEGRNGLGNIFFKGPTIYSYGYHFPMAIFVTPNLVLVNSHQYSPTTQRHLSAVRQALPSHVETFEVPNVLSSIGRPIGDREHLLNLQYFVNSAVECAELLTRVRSDYRKGALTHTILSYQKQAEKYVKYFKVRVKGTADVLRPLRALDPTDPEVMERYKLAHKVKLGKKRKAEKVSRAKALKEWLAGTYRGYSLHSNPTVYLRYSSDGETIQTSHGANVPAREGELLYRAWVAGKPVHGLRIGNFTINSANTNVVTIGCHKITRKVADEFFKGEI